MITVFASLLFHTIIHILKVTSFEEALAYANASRQSSSA